MAVIFSISFLISIWLSFTSYVYRFFDKNLNNDIQIKKNIFLSLSLGFIFTFLIIADLNLFLHLFGYNFKFNFILIPLPFIIIFFYKTNIRYLYKEIIFSFQQIFKLSNQSFVKNDFFINSLYLVLIVQVACLLIRSFLPLTHGDAFGQYFFESLQISRLENLKILEFYKMGESFRSDSLASFFDSFFIQLTNNWSIARFTRLASLVLVILSSLEMVSNLGSINFKKGLILICVILTIPDVWSVFISGKHDGYVFLFEFTGIYIISLSIISKDKILRLILSLLSIFLAFIGVSSRLSSLSFLLISLVLLSFNLLKFRKYFFNNKSISLKKYNLFPRIILCLLALFIAFIILMINYHYFSNPFYMLSPPGFLTKVFPNASYKMDYIYIKDTLSLRNIPLIFKPISTFLYASLGMEPIRHVLNQLKDKNDFFLFLFGTFDFFGPKFIMVSILSFNPLVLLPFTYLKSLKNYEKSLLFLLTFWIILWSLSIPYTRTAISSSLALIVLGLSNIKGFNSNSFNSLNSLLKLSIFSYGILSIYFFTIWSVSNLYDLPVSKLVMSKEYSRTSLSREFIKLQNETLGNKNIIPTLKFEESWKKIEADNPDKFLFLEAPSHFAYFMNRGLITNKKLALPSRIENDSLCFEIDLNRELIKKTC